MTQADNYNEIIEGATAMFVPSTKHLNGPMARSEPVFYNPAMRGNRDISVLFERVIAEDGWNILDGLAASGAKGLRLYEEGKHDCEIVINDHSPKAFELILKNTEHWDRGDRVIPSNHGLHGLLPEKKYNWVDIDPFGSPVDFLDGSIRAVKSRGILSITATDTAPLCGTYPTTCIRRYGSRPLHKGTMHDTGLRILVGNTIKRAAVFDVAAIPILSYFSGHYFRCYFRMKRGAKPADALLKQFGFIIWSKDGGYTTVPWPEKGAIHGGPLWLGSLNDQDLLGDMVRESEDPDMSISTDSINLLRDLKAEIPSPSYIYMTDEIASKCKVHPPNTKLFVKSLKDKGFQASTVHYDTKGIRTDADWATIRELAKLMHK